MLNNRIIYWNNCKGRTINLFMKIENIIEDIKKDVVELSEKLEERFRSENPGVKFSVSLPDIEELCTIKSVVLSMELDSSMYCLSVYIHTHNGNRVFENEAKQIINDEFFPYEARHPFQDGFVDMLRDIIKKNKNKAKTNKSSSLYNDATQYAHSAW